MARTAAERLRRSLVSELRAKDVIRSAEVEAAFAAVARERFVAQGEHGLEAVYRDEAIVTKRDARGMPLSSSSQPALMAKMLELLQARPGDRVLEIGAGTGYNAALLKQIVGADGRITSVDVDQQVARQARRALRSAGYRASVIAGDGREGHARGAPYDRIIVTACAEKIHRAWFEQLADGGRLELPLRLDPDGEAIQLIPVLERRAGCLRSVGLTWGGFMPLHGGDGGWRPVPAALGANRSRSGTHQSLVSLSGGGIGRLSDANARTLLASMLAMPREPIARGMIDFDSARPPLLLIYLLLTIPASRRVSLRTDGRLGIGLVDRRGRGLAMVSLRSPWMTNGYKRNSRARWRLDAYGEGDAAPELEHLLARWRQLRQSGRATLRATARPHGDVLRVSFTWGHG